MEKDEQENAMSIVKNIIQQHSKGINKQQIKEERVVKRLNQKPILYLKADKRDVTDDTCDLALQKLNRENFHKLRTNSFLEPIKTLPHYVCLIHHYQGL